MRDAPLIEAIHVAGSVTKLAVSLGIASQAVSQWRRVPATRVLAVENVTGIPRHKLRPDMYPPEPAPETANG